MESKDNFLEKFLIIVDKNKINHPAPLPNFSDLCYGMNLPSFKKFYSYEELFNNDKNIYSNMGVKEKVSFLTVFGIKYKYLNRKKCFPTKLTNEQLKLKKAFVCIEIMKFDSEKVKLNYNQILYGALEKINQHFEDTWKEFEYSFKDEYFVFAVWNLGRLCSEFDEKSKAEEYSKIIAKSLKWYIAKPEENAKKASSLELLRDYMFVKLRPRSQKWLDKLAFKMNSVLSNNLISPDDDVALFDLQIAIKNYFKRNNQKKLLQNSKFIQTFICNKMFPLRIEYRNACKARLDDATAKLNEEKANLKDAIAKVVAEKVKNNDLKVKMEKAKVKSSKMGAKLKAEQNKLDECHDCHESFKALKKEKEFYEKAYYKMKELNENAVKAQDKVIEAQDKLNEAHADFSEAITGMDGGR